MHLLSTFKRHAVDGTLVATSIDARGTARTVPGRARPRRIVRGPAIADFL
ncbi:hypothetical protein C7S14_8312 [Burkholderia cepacia]|nr:hypothetical protein [Burkholderia cepacia]QOH36002.1 hypothetical protein C7S14_8312 [Burkholderia cepacia]